MSRTCSVCSDPHHVRIDRDLSSARPIKELVAQYGIGESSLYRHSRAHLKMTLLQQTRFEGNLGSTDLVARLVEALDDASAVRSAALMSGNGTLVLRAANTVHGLATTLLDRLGFDDVSLLQNLREAGALAEGVGALVRKAPKVGLALAHEIGTDSPELIEALEQLARESSTPDGKAATSRRPAP